MDLSQWGIVQFEIGGISMRSTGIVECQDRHAHITSWNRPNIVHIEIGTHMTVIIHHAVRVIFFICSRVFLLSQEENRANTQTELNWFRGRETIGTHATYTINRIFCLSLFHSIVAGCRSVNCSYQCFHGTGIERGSERSRRRMHVVCTLPWPILFAAWQKWRKVKRARNWQTNFSKIEYSNVTYDGDGRNQFTTLDAQAIHTLHIHTRINESIVYSKFLKKRN